MEKFTKEFLKYFEQFYTNDFENLVKWTISQ